MSAFQEMAARRVAVLEYVKALSADMSALIGRMDVETAERIAADDHARKATEEAVELLRGTAEPLERLRGMEEAVEVLQAEMASVSGAIQAIRKEYHLTHSMTCKVCGRTFESSRSDTKYCRQGCRFKAYRERKKEAAEDTLRGLQAEVAELKRAPGLVEPWRIP